MTVKGFLLQYVLHFCKIHYHSVVSLQSFTEQSLFYEICYKPTNHKEIFGEITANKPSATSWQQVGEYMFFLSDLQCKFQA